MAASMRTLVAGSGTVGATAGERRLTFSQAQSFKEGATVAVGGAYCFTIDVGSGTQWTTLQKVTVTVSGQPFVTSDPGTGRTRGGASAGPIVPRAMHFVYRAPLDASGNPDWYFYGDTLFPENGVHPYTKDQYTGISWFANPVDPNVAGALVPDLATRVRLLEGAVRGGSGTIADPDSRLDGVTSRLVALEQWANRVGTNTPPAVGSSATYTVEQLTSYGDPAPA